MSVAIPGVVSSGRHVAFITDVVSDPYHNKTTILSLLRRSFEPWNGIGADTYITKNESFRYEALVPASLIAPHNCESVPFAGVDGNTLGRVEKLICPGIVRGAPIRGSLAGVRRLPLERAAAPWQCRLLTSLVLSVLSMAIPHCAWPEPTASDSLPRAARSLLAAL